MVVDWYVISKNKADINGQRGIKNNYIYNKTQCYSENSKSEIITLLDF